MLSWRQAFASRQLPWSALQAWGEEGEGFGGNDYHLLEWGAAAVLAGRGGGGADDGLWLSTQRREERVTRALSADTARAKPTGILAPRRAAAAAAAGGGGEGGEHSPPRRLKTQRHQLSASRIELPWSVLGAPLLTTREGDP